MRILVADDNSDCAASLQMLLQAEGHCVSTACDGEQAIEMAGLLHPDAAILDIGMPRLDGFAAARRIRDAHPSVLIMAYTGYSGAEFRKQGIESGFDHYFSKFETSRMLEAIAERAGKHARSGESAGSGQAEKAQAGRAAQPGT